MLVIGLVLGVLLSVLLCTVAFLAGRVSWGVQAEVEETIIESIKEDIQEVLEDFSGKGHSMVITKNVEAQMSDLMIDWVKAYGTKYHSISDALELCEKLTDEERKELIDIQAEMKVIRSENIAPRRFRKEITRHGETVVVYEPCLMKIDVPSREGKPARIAVKIIREGLLTFISEVYTSDTDVTNPSERYTWKWDNPDRVDAFELLIGSDEEFAAEVDELIRIEDEIEEYNEYVTIKKRIALGKNGEIVLLPPSLEELKARMGLDNEEPAVEEEAVVEVVEPQEEFVSSSAK